MIGKKKVEEGTPPIPEQAIETSKADVQAQRFIQDNPTAVAIGGAFIAGFALGRRRSR